MESKTKHLEMIQGIITRLAHCSFLLKGWSVILISALFALAVKDTRIYFIYLAYFPAISFWGLDGYYLRQEKLFRALYDRVRKMNEADIDFSMDTSVVSEKVDCWLCVALSKTLIAFHGTIIFTIIVVMSIVIYLMK